MVSARIIYFLFVFVAILCPSSGWGQDLQWVKYVKGPFDDSFTNATKDSAGYIYVTGHVGAPGATINGNYFSVSGHRDILLTKYNASGAYQWAVTAGGSRNTPDVNERERGTFVRYNIVSNEVVLVGTYDSDEIYFGPGLSAVGRGMFIAGYSTSGTCQWLQTVGAGQPNGIVLDQAGNTYIQLNREGSFDDCFVNKYSSTGDLLWSRSPGFHVNGGLSMKGDSLLILTGYTQSNAELLGVPLATSSSVFDGIYATFDTALTQVVSSQQYLSTGYALLKEAIPLTAGVIVSGIFSDTTVFGNDTLLPQPNSPQPFVARLDDLGNVVWLKWYSLTSSFNALARISLAIDSTVYVCFTSTGAVDFGGITVTPSSVNDFFVARYDLAGNYIGLMHGGAIQIGTDVLCTNDGGFILNGWFDTTLNLDGGAQSQGSTDGFIAKFNAITGIQTFGNLGGGQLHIYANPNNGLCTVDLPQDLRYTSDLMLTVFDAQGRAVQSSPVRNSETGIELDITAHAKGSYFVELSDGQQRYTGTIVFY